MSLFVLIPGAGGAAWYWHRVVPELRARGHEAVAVDLPGADESAGLPEYADAVVAAIGAHRDVVVVTQSMGGFTGPVACTRTPVRLLVLVNAMVPLPSETPGDWWDDTGWEPAGSRPRRRADTPPGSTWPPISCTTCPRRSRPRGRRTPIPRRTSPSANPAPSSDGRMCRSGSSPAGTTGSSRWSSSGGWRGNVSAPISTWSPAATWPPCPGRPSSPTS